MGTTEFVFGILKKETDSSVSCTTLHIDLLSLNCTFYIGYNGKFYVYLTTIKPYFKKEY